jgi:hypothetical protein
MLKPYSKHIHSSVLLLAIYHQVVTSKKAMQMGNLGNLVKNQVLSPFKQG